MSRADRWEELASARMRLSGQIATLDPEDWGRPSRCRGWLVRDVLGHLVHMAEATTRSMIRDLRESGGGDRDRGFLLCAQRIGQQPVPELCERLRASAASRYNHMPVVALSEVLVHGDDMLRPLGVVLDCEPSTAVRVLGHLARIYRLAARVAYHGRAHGGVRLVGTDVAWASGRGPEVTGSALDLMALLTNRAGALDQLQGPGVQKLADRAVTV